MNGGLTDLGFTSAGGFWSACKRVQRIPRGDHHHLHLTSRHSGTCNPLFVPFNDMCSCNPYAAVRDNPPSQPAGRMALLAKTIWRKCHRIQVVGRGRRPLLCYTPISEQN
ncbi:UNVERIFIED_CONTAM: hypothetical protein Sindi_0682100 [Sesamum indicum]